MGVAKTNVAQRLVEFACWSESFPLYYYIQGSRFHSHAAKAILSSSLRMLLGPWKERTFRDGKTDQCADRGPLVTQVFQHANGEHQTRLEEACR